MMNPVAPTSDPLHIAVATYLVNAVQFGTVTIRYQHGQPTHIERLEIVRLTKDPAVT